MAFNARSLSLYASTPFGSAGKTVNWYKYATPDAVATVTTSAYFDSVKSKLSINDQIDAACLTDAVSDRVSLIVTAVSPNVTVAINTDASGA